MCSTDRELKKKLRDHLTSYESERQKLETESEVRLSELEEQKRLNTSLMEELQNLKAKLGTYGHAQVRVSSARLRELKQIAPDRRPGTSGHVTPSRDLSSSFAKSGSLSMTQSSTPNDHSEAQDSLNNTMTFPTSR